MQRRRVLKAFAAFAALGAGGAEAQAPAMAPATASFPSRPVRIVVPFSPGGSSDILGRTVAQALAEAWHQQIVVENKPGAGGVPGVEAVARAEPDGSTLLLGHIGTLAVNPSIYPKLPYDPLTDFAPIGLVAMVPSILVVNPSVPARDVRELVALAKAKPGTLTYGSGGPGTGANLGMEYFKLATGTDIAHVIYKGTGPVVTDLIDGRISMTMTGLPPVLAHIRSGKLRALGVASKARLQQLPDVPTMIEAGVPDFEATQWYGVLAPAATPRAIVLKIANDMRTSLARPELSQRLIDEGAQPGSLYLAEFGAFIRSEIARWSKVVRAARIKPA